VSDLRETIIPVCRIVDCPNDASGGTEFKLNNTALKVGSITQIGGDFDIFPVGETDVTVCALKADDGSIETSATATVIIEQNYTTSSFKEINITNAGIYDGSIDSVLVVSGPGNVGDGVGGAASPTFQVNLIEANIPVSYITVTDLQGDNGFFRVSPGSGTNYYLSSLPKGDDYPKATADLLASFGVSAVSGAGSGIPGVIAAAGSTAILTLPYPIDTIQIENLTYPLVNESLFAINYGMIKTASRIGDNQATEPQ